MWWASSSGALGDVGRDLAHHAGVVDEDVERPGLGVGSLAAVDVGVGDVELLGLQREAASVGQLLRGAFRGGGIAGGDDHVMAELRELPRHLPPDAPSRAADEGYGSARRPRTRSAAMNFIEDVLERFPSREPALVDDLARRASGVSGGSGS